MVHHFGRMRAGEDLLECNFLHLFNVSYGWKLVRLERFQVRDRSNLIGDYILVSFCATSNSWKPGNLIVVMKIFLVAFVGDPF